MEKLYSSLVDILFNNLKINKLVSTVFMLSSLFFINSISAQLNGTFTIGTGEDYSTFNDAIDALQEGVIGPVTFLVSNGTYNEQLILLAIPGASATNNITIRSGSGNAADVTIHHAATTVDDNFVLKFDNAAHYRIRDLTLRADGSSYSLVVNVINTATNLEFLNINIQGPLINSTSTQNAVMAILTTTGTNIQLLNNNIYGGSYGIYFNSKNTVNSIISQNIILESFERGVSLYYLSSGTIDKNEITSRRPTSIGLQLNNCNLSLNNHKKMKVISG